MKIKLVTSPHLQHFKLLQDDAEIGNPSVMYSFAPVGLLMLVAVTRQNLGIKPIIYDLNRRIIDGTIALNDKFYQNVASAICADSPDIVGFMTECDSYHHVLAICAAIKEIHPHCIIELGGPHASAVAKVTMERCPYIDAIVMGESEISFPLFLTSCMAGDDYPIPGVLRRAKNGLILEGAPCALVEDLNDLPPPAYDIYEPDPDEAIFLEVGRGCPFQCTFCSTAPYWHRRHRVKSPKRILSEIQWLIELFGTSCVHFTHDLFTTNRAWVQEVCQILIEANVPILWTCSSRTDTVDDELLALMSHAGCKAIYFGVESGSERILKEINKNISLNHSLEIFRICNKYGITPNPGFIAGFPSEDMQSLTDTFTAFTQALKVGCKPVHLFGFCPFAGSLIYKTLKDMENRGHFLDLPLGKLIEEKNRKIIASDIDLFGSYFRPRLPHLSINDHNLIDGIDEFSLLVDVARLPCLILAEIKGGMMVLYQEWISWISTINDKRGISIYRRYYGSPVTFCDFLIEKFKENILAPDFAISLTSVIRMNILLAAKWQRKRQIINPEQISSLYENSEDIKLDSYLSLGNIVAKLEVAYDIREMLTDSPFDETYEPQKNPIFLVWQITSTGDLKLLDVDKPLFHVLDKLEKEPRTVRELITHFTQNSNLTGATKSHEILNIFKDAIEANLIYLKNTKEKEDLYYVDHSSKQI